MCVCVRALKDRMRACERESGGLTGRGGGDAWGQEDNRPLRPAKGPFLWGCRPGLWPQHTSQHPDPQRDAASPGARPRALAGVPGDSFAALQCCPLTGRVSGQAAPFPHL